MIWQIAHRAHQPSREIADRHYNRQKIGSKQFVPPGRCVVLYTETEAGKAFWVTSWPFAEYVKHEWDGAWVCSAFRNEGAGEASTLIRQALAATRHIFGDAPAPHGMVTFVDPSKVKPTTVKGCATWGYTWVRSGFRYIGQTKAGLLCFGLAPEDMPAPEAPIGWQGSLEVA